MRSRLVLHQLLNRFYDARLILVEACETAIRVTVNMSGQRPRPLSLNRKSRGIGRADCLKTRPHARTHARPHARPHARSHTHSNTQPRPPRHRPPSAPRVPRDLACGNGGGPGAGRKAGPSLVAGLSPSPAGAPRGGGLGRGRGLDASHLDPRAGRAAACGWVIKGAVRRRGVEPGTRRFCRRPVSAVGKGPRFDPVRPRDAWRSATQCRGEGRLNTF